MTENLLALLLLLLYNQDKVADTITHRGIQFLDLWKLERFEVQPGVKMNFFGLGFWSITISWAMGTIFPSPPHLDCKETLVFWLLIAPSNSLYCTFTCLLISMYIAYYVMYKLNVHRNEIGVVDRLHRYQISTIR